MHTGSSLSSYEKTQFVEFISAVALETHNTEYIYVYFERVTVNQ